MRHYKCFKATFIYMFVFFFMAPSVNADQELLIIEFLSRELDMPLANIQDIKGDLSLEAKLKLIVRPDVAERLEAKIQGMRATDVLADDSSMDELEPHMAQMELESYIGWAEENNVPLEQDMIDELLSMGAIMPGELSVVESEPSIDTTLSDSDSVSTEAHNSTIPVTDFQGVVYVWGKPTNVYSPAFGMTVLKWKGAGVHLILKDGTAIFKPDASPSDFDIETFKQTNPKKFSRLENLDVEENEFYPPRQRGYVLDIYVERPSTSVSGGNTNISWKKLRFSKDGRFETSKTTIASTNYAGRVITFDPVRAITSSGGFTAGSSNSLGNGASLVRRGSGDVGNDKGTYFIDGLTIELKYDNGMVVRSLFATNGKDDAILGNTKYWTPKQ